MTKKIGVMALSDEQLEEYDKKYDLLSKEELEEYDKKYDLLSKEELQKCAAAAEAQIGVKFKGVFERKIEIIQEEKKRALRHGIRAVRTQPLVHVLSAAVASEDESLALYGSIRAEYNYDEYDLFKCESDAPQFIGTNGLLPLKGPDFLCDVMDGGILLESDIVVQLFDQTGKEYVNLEFIVDDESDKDFEVVVSKSIPCERGTLTLRYIVIPHGVGSRIHINVFRRGSPEKDSFDVSGRIVVKYANTYGHSSSGSEECVLFDQQGEESERVLVKNLGELRLLRCWVALSAYSVLHVDVDLKISGSDHKIVGTVKLYPEQGWGSNDTVVGDDYVVTVNAAWFSPEPICCVPYIEPRQSSPRPYPAMEIFSVWICREKGTETSSRVYGSIEVEGGHPIISIFNRDRENALPASSDRMICVPVSYGCRNFGGWSENLDIKLDIKDVENSLVIKGTVEWDAIIFEDYHGNMLCSMFRGQHGYAAVHYAVFPNAVEASIRVYHHLDSRVLMAAGYNIVSLWFEGIVEAEYGDYGYSTKYDKKYFPIVLFKQHDGVERNCRDFYEIPLSRSRIVVPSNSDLHLTFRLRLLNRLGRLGESLRPPGLVEEYDQVAKIEMGEKEKTLKGLWGHLCVEVNWREIKG